MPEKYQSSWRFPDITTILNNVCGTNPPGLLPARIPSSGAQKSITKPY